MEADLLIVKKHQNKKIHHTPTIEQIVNGMKKNGFLPILCSFFPRKLSAHTLKSASIQTTDVLRPVYTRSRPTLILRTVDWVFFFPSLNECLNTVTELRHITSKTQFEASFNTKFLNTNLAGTTCACLDVLSFLISETFVPLLLARDWQSQIITKKKLVVGFPF